MTTNTKKINDASSQANLFKDRTWRLSHDVCVETHQYDDALYAFECTQRNRCLGTVIPKDIGDMLRMEYILDNDIPVDGFKCNDEFNTIIHVKQ